MDHLTRQDLDRALDKQSQDIKEHILLLIAPIITEQDKVRTVLFGASLLNGLAGKMKTMAAHLKIIYIVLTGSLVKIFYDYMMT